MLLECPAVTVTIIPTSQTKNVRQASQRVRANALMYFVTATPAVLQIKIEKRPEITIARITPLPTRVLK